MKTAPVLTLTSRQKRLVRESFESIVDYYDGVVLLFYGRLFEMDPSAKALFKIDIREQARKLLETLTAIIGALDHFEILLPWLEELGQRHVTYGVKPHQYDTLRSALLWALGQALGEVFDPETKASWGVMLDSVIAAMRENAGGPAAETPPSAAAPPPGGGATS